MAKEKWDEQFATNKFTYGKNANQFIQEKSNVFPKGAKIACLAEGEGRNAIYLAKQGYDVTAFDISTVGLEHATQLAEENLVAIQTVQADLTEKQSFHPLYDGAVMIFGHVEKADQRMLFTNLFDAVKPGGHILFEVYSEAQLPYDTGGPGKIAYLYDPQDILAWIAPYECPHFYVGEVDRREGYRHTGLGHVIQAVIKK